MYRIIYRSTSGIEIIDTADTEQEARTMVNEYRLAFHSNNINHELAQFTNVIRALQDNINVTNKK